MAARTLAVQAEVAAAMTETVTPGALAGVTAAMGKIGARLQALLSAEAA